MNPKIYRLLFALTLGFVLSSVIALDVSIQSTFKVDNLVATGSADVAGAVIARSGITLASDTGPTINTSASSPNGVVTAPIGSLVTLTSTPQVWVNTNAGTVWDTLVNPTSAGSDFIFGTAWDGDLHFDGVTVVKGITPVANVYTGPLDIFANNVIIDAGVTVRPQSRVVFINGTLSGTGTLSWNGTSSTGAAGGAAIGQSITPGAGSGNTWNTGSIDCTAVPMNNVDAGPWCVTNVAANGGGTSNVVLNNGTNGTACRGGGGGGSSAGVGGGGTTGGSVTLTGGAWELQSSPFTMGWMGRKAAVPANLFGNQSSGGCGIGAGGGSGGGWAFAMIRNCGTGSVTLTARGGNGASATGPWTTCNAGGACRCSGGGGGPGGTMFVYCGQGTLPTTDNTPGDKGLGVTISGTLQCANSAGTPGTGPGNCCPGNGGCGGVGHKALFSPSTGWIHTTDPAPAGC